MGPGTRAAIRRIVWPMILVGLTTVGAATALPAPNPSLAQIDQRPESTACPNMTDSVNRLFLAYFNRTPDGAEFRNWTEQYRSGQANLEAISQQLAESDEFRTRYGSLGNERYVERVYRNVLRRQPSQADREFWIASLDSGYPRGAVMVAFSESEEFVRRTGTAVPLSGYLRWYPEGVHWYCGIGPRVELDIKPLEEPDQLADLLFNNQGNEQSPVGFVTRLNGQPHLTIADGSLPPGFTDYKWGGSFAGDGNYGSALTVVAGRNTSWIAVFYPNSIGEQRLGWQLES